MNENKLRQPARAPLGSVEPHAPLLNLPADGQLLYKVMTIENLLRSIEGSYLHFKRVDSYRDDKQDGEQLLQDRHGSAMARFAKAPEFSAADYYDRTRARTYACCFSLENSDYIKTNYANDSKKGKICIVFNFGKLRSTLNHTLQPGSAVLEYNCNRCHQIFTVNYGTIEYVEWDRHQINEEYLANPIKYIYLKDKKFFEEKELRVSLIPSIFGIGQFIMNDGSKMDFPPSLQMGFNFGRAFADGTIQQISYLSGCDSAFIHAVSRKLHIVSAKKSIL